MTTVIALFFEKKINEDAPTAIEPAERFVKPVYIFKERSSRKGKIFSTPTRSHPNNKVLGVGC